MNDDLPNATFGKVGSQVPDWRRFPDQSDPDDERIETPDDVTGMLGFDPAQEEDTEARSRFAAAAGHRNGTGTKK